MKTYDSGSCSLCDVSYACPNTKLSGQTYDNVEFSPLHLQSGFDIPVRLIKIPDS